MGKLKKKRFVWTVLLVFAFCAIIFYAFPLRGYIPVLMYHFIYPKSKVGTNSLNLSIDNFHRQMWFLRTFRFKPISLEEYYAIKTGQKKAQGKEVVVTFDDGHITYLQYALPILERYQIPSVNFLIWNHLLSGIPAYISLEDAKRLSHHPLVTLGSHTLSHPILVEIGIDQAKTEIVESKKKLENILNKDIHYFCYPTGAFNEEIIQLVQGAGYRLAFTTTRKHLNGHFETLYSITRIKVHNKYNLFVFWLEVAGFGDYAKRIDAFFHQLTHPKGNDKLKVYKPQNEMT